MIFPSGDKARFVYYEDKYENLMNKIDVLKNHGFVEDVTFGNLPLYRMTDKFIELLRATGDVGQS